MQNSKSKWWKEMFIPNDGELEGIISTESPIEYSDSKKKISIQRGISKEEYDQFCDFIKKQNKMASGNYTLLPKSELGRYIRFNARVLTMKGGDKSTLIGTLLSVPFPIKCILDQEQLITHGCTSFLNVHQILRNHGLCMALIRELIVWGHEDEIYCDYHMTHNQIHEKAFQITSWYRPLNLPKSIGLGFLIPNWNIPSKFVKNRLKYNCKMPSKFKCIRVEKKTQEKALKFYKDVGKNMKFIFWPDLDLFAHWIQEFPTFLVRTKKDKKIVGIFSITSLFCRMGEEIHGKLCLPLLFNCLEEYGMETMRSLIHIANEREHDTLYVYQIGNITRDVLESVNCVETKDKSWFSLYNNAMNLDPESISVPLI